MLLYPHSFAGLPLLYQVAGSAVPRAVVPALMSMILTLIIEETISQEFLNHIFAHPYPYTVFANLVGFTLVFRNNIAYNRYWEGITQLRQMSAKWGDVLRTGSNLPVPQTSASPLPATRTPCPATAGPVRPPSTHSRWTATRNPRPARRSPGSTRSARRARSTAPRSATASRCCTRWPSRTCAARSSCASSPMRPSSTAPTSPTSGRSRRVRTAHCSSLSCAAMRSHHAQHSGTAPHHAPHRARRTRRTPTGAAG